MKQLIVAILSTTLLCACTQSRVEKANALLPEGWSPITEECQLDSVIGFPEWLQKHSEVAERGNAAAQLYREVMEYGLNSDCTQDSVRNKIISMRDELLTILKEQLDLTDERDYLEFSKGIKGEQKEHLGYSYTTNDSTVYFDTELTKVLFVELPMPNIEI